MEEVWIFTALLMLLLISCILFFYSLRSKQRKIEKKLTEEIEKEQKMIQALDGRLLILEEAGALNSEDWERRLRESRMLIDELKQLEGVRDQVLELLTHLEDEKERAEQKKKSLEDLLQSLGSKQEAAEFYQKHSLREISGMPRHTVIGEDGWPKIYGADGWGEYYTRYRSFDGKCYHTHNCQFGYSPVHVFDSSCPRVPCGSCHPKPLPSRDWYDEYQRHLNLCIRERITPKADEMPE